MYTKYEVHTQNFFTHPCNTAFAFTELFKAESLSQLWFKICQLTEKFPGNYTVRQQTILFLNFVVDFEKNTILYDDFCHYDKYKRNPKRSQINEVTKRVALMKGFIDKTHSGNHQKSCQEIYSAYKSADINGINTQSCEQFFSWFSGFRWDIVPDSIPNKVHIFCKTFRTKSSTFSVKHMTQTHFKFFTLMMLWIRNLQNEKKLCNSNKYQT